MSNADDSSDAVRLRNRLADELVVDGVVTSGAVEAAFRTVPRHLFAPEASLEEAYARDRLVTKRDEHGVTISSVSAPQIQALMLEQARLEPGMRVLEIGSGGYNAALMAELVGPITGAVSSIDIDPDVVVRARRCLAKAGYRRVTVTLGDGEDGCAPDAPFDAIVVTAGAWDVPPAWMEQLTEGGTLTLPLRMRGLTRSMTFTRADEHWESRSAKVCGFVAMQGAGQRRERLLLLRGKEIGLRFDDDGWPADPSLLDGVFDAEPVQVWPGVRVGRSEPFDTLQLWLATVFDGFCLLAVDKDLDTGLVQPVNRIASPAVVDKGTLAYLSCRRLDQHDVEFGAYAFGPDASALAEALAAQVLVWDRELRGGPGPRFALYPSGSAQPQRKGCRVIPKRHVNVGIYWPSSTDGTDAAAAP